MSVQITALLIGPTAAAVEGLESRITQLNLTLLTATHWDRAENVLETFAPQVVLVASDSRGADTLDMLDRLASIPEAKDTPVVVIAPAEGVVDRAAAHELGAVCVVAGDLDGACLEDLVTGLARIAQERDAWRRQGNENQCLLEIASLLHSTAEPEKILTVVANRIASMVPLSTCSIILVSPAGDTAIVATGAAALDGGLLGPEAELELSRFPELREVVHKGNRLMLEALTHDPFEITISQDDESADVAGTRGSALFPILANDEVQGVLSLHLPVLAPPLTQAQVPFFERAAATCGRTLSDIRRRLAADEQPDRVSFEATDPSLGEHDLLVNLVEHSPNAIVASDPAGTVLVFNRSAEKLWGYRHDEVIGRLNSADLLMPGAGVEVYRILESSELGEPGYVHNLQTEALSRDGEIIPVGLSASYLMEDGEPVASVGIFQDLRQRLALESRLQEMSAQLVESEKQATLAALAGTTAHELNQPLTTVMGLVELLQFKVADDEPLTAQLQRIYDETERMSAIVRRIGKITKFSTTTYVGETEILDLDKSSDSSK